MTLFYINNAGPEPLKPLSRKFRVREILPTEEPSSSQAIHTKNESDFSNVLAKALPRKAQDQKTNQEHSQQQAAQAYRDNQSDSQLNLGKVRDIMSKSVLTMQIGQTLGEAWRLMQKYEIHHLPVLDPDGRLCGMLSESLILPFLMRPSPAPYEPEQLPLDTFCQQALISTSPNALIKDLVPSLLENDLDGVAVTENGFLSGIVTYTDILKVVIKMQAFNVDA